MIPLCSETSTQQKACAKPWMDQGNRQVVTLALPWNRKKGTHDLPYLLSKAAMKPNAALNNSISVILLFENNTFDVADPFV